MAPMACATSAALPTLVWTKMYACTTISWYLLRFPTAVSSYSQGASSVFGGRPRTLADVRHATGFSGTVLIGHWGVSGIREVGVNLSRDATLAEVGEFPLIAAITERLSLAGDVRVGPGDDAAVLAIKDAVAMSVDVLVEGVHFRRDWSEARDVGRKAVAVNVADLEAVGARATGLLVGFSAPADLTLGWVLDFADGLCQEGQAAGVSVVGGDVTRARDITIAVTAM